MSTWFRTTAAALTVAGIALAGTACGPSSPSGNKLTASPSYSQPPGDIGGTGTTTGGTGTTTGGTTTGGTGTSGTPDRLSLTANGAGQQNCPNNQLDGCYTRDQMKQFIDDTLPMVKSFFDTTYKALPEPTSIYYVADGITGPEGCTTADGSPASYSTNSYEYCSKDNSIYLGQDAIWGLYSEDGAVSPVAGLAHEWGHEDQYQVHVPDPTNATQSINHENQADCVAGAWERYAYGKGWIDNTLDTQNLNKFLVTIGSAEGPDRDHGTTAERSQSFNLGSQGGIAACNAFYPQNPIIVAAQ